MFNIFRRLLRLTYIFILISFVICFSLCNKAFCANKSVLPRFASIKSDRVYVRRGPAKSCPIEWVYTQKDEPIEIIAEYDGDWRQIKDVDGDVGWAHVSVLSKNRFIKVTKDESSLFNSYDKKVVIAKLDINLVCRFLKCKDDVCKIKCDKYVGWISRDSIWGVNSND